VAIVANSSFLDSYGNQLATPQQFATLSASTGLANARSVLAPLLGVSASDIKPADAATSITVAVTVNRANDPTTLFAADWSTRQAALADQNAVWSKYGADPATYAAVIQTLRGIVGDSALTAPTSAGYVSSTADRTIWMTLNPTQFSALFGTDLLDARGTLAWGGNLSVPDSIAASVRGLWIDRGGFISNPAVFETKGITLTEGPLGIGNASTSKLHATPTAVAANYQFPLADGGSTGAVALVESNVPSQAKLFAAYNDYRKAIGLDPVAPSQFRAVTGASDLPGTPSGELTLDVSVVAGAVPRSTVLLYAYGGGTPFKAYQQAFFDTANDPGILSSSWAIIDEPTRGSPFQTAYQDLFVDGALSKVSVHIAAGDQGATGYYSNGVPNVASSDSPLMALAVSGTSLATLNSAKSDPTLAALLAKALNSDPATLLQLTASGLKTLPSSLSDTLAANPSSTLPAMIETVWNSLEVTHRNATTLQAPFGANLTGSGGAVTSLPIPSYQTKFGLTPTSVLGIGRGSPDVTALSAGDSSYAVLNNTYVTDPSGSSLLANTGGTSAASPLWASLTAQLNTIFADQGLPQLGFYNDLLYQAAALAPASFNDITLGNNINTFYKSSTHTGYYNQNTDTHMVPTGLGYSAAPGYDLASGLGSPNGLLLARTLTAIAHAQTWSKTPGVLSNTGASSGESTLSQTLLVQDELGVGTASVLQVGTSVPVAAVGGSPLAWTSRLAQQSLQREFDPALVTLLDGAAQGTIFSVGANAKANVDVMAGGSALPLYQIDYTNPFGIVQFGNAGGDVTLARPVAIAQTAGGAGNQDAILRIRQNGVDSLKLEIYKADDFNGTIGGIAPGQAGYAAAAAARDYRTESGTTVISGPGYGNYAEARLKGINPGDILAMHLTNASTGDTYWAFASANEMLNGAHVTHLWSYGLNTWGWEDRRNGGDRDYNDLIVGIDFTSASGHAFIA
jgi:hypothetical protein